MLKKPKYLKKLPGAGIEYSAKKVRKMDEDESIHGEIPIEPGKK